MAHENFCTTQALLHSTLFLHPDPYATLGMAVDTLDFAIKPIQRQRLIGLGFCFGRINGTESKYDVFDQELLAA